MTQKETIKWLEQNEIGTIWDEEKEEWYFSIVDVVRFLTDSPNPNNYWEVLKNRLKEEGSELATVCNQLNMRSEDGKLYKTDIANIGQLLRLIHAIYSTRLELFN